MDILNKEVCLKNNDGAVVSGVVLIQNYQESPTRNGGTYLQGSLQALGDISFKVWSGSCFDYMSATDYAGKICFVTATVNEYNGTKSLILSSISALTEEEISSTGIKPVDLMSSKYPIETYWNTLVKTVEKYVSPNALQVFNLLISDYKDRFKTEFAALNYHDNCKGGLVAHTTKVVNLCGVIKVYTNVALRVSADILYVSAALHDIAKVLEYLNGCISEQGKYLSHNIMGCLIIEKYKQEIIDLMGEEFYLTLLSVISQHHGEFGDRPRTVCAYIVHLLDNLESSLALLDQTIESNPSGQLKFNNMNLI